MPLPIARYPWFAAALLAACGRDVVDARTVFPDPTVASLAEAAAEGDKARVQELVRGGADPNGHGDKGVTVLQWALYHQSVPGLEALLQAGADPSAADSAGQTAVHLAERANDPQYLDVLLRGGADPNTPHAVTRSTPLVSALMGNREEQFHALLRAGAKPNLADRMGDTPLHEAAKINAYERVIDLLEAGADPAAVNRRGTTFRKYMEQTPENILTEKARKGRAEVYAWLARHGYPATP